MRLQPANFRGNKQRAKLVRKRHTLRGELNAIILLVAIILFDKIAQQGKIA